MSDPFLFFVFFFPRLTLLFCYLSGNIPPNSTELAVDLIAAIFAPRLLIAYWLFQANANELLIALFLMGEVMEKMQTILRK